MKLTYSQVAKSVKSLKVLSNLELPYGVTLKLSKNIKAIEDAFQEYIKENRELADKYFEKDNKGNFVKVNDTEGAYKVKEGKIEDFKKDQDTLNDFEVEIPIYLINVDELVDLKISSTVMINIDFMFKLSDGDLV